MTSPEDVAFTKGDKTYTCAQIRDGGLAPPEHRQAASLCPRLNGADVAQLDARQVELDAVNAAISALDKTTWPEKEDETDNLNATPLYSIQRIAVCWRLTHFASRQLLSLATQVFEPEALWQPTVFIQAVLG